LAQGYTPLHVAMDSKQTAVVERIIDKGADV
jgi:ankyrin repeat protein